MGEKYSTRPGYIGFVVKERKNRKGKGAYIQPPWGVSQLREKISYVSYTVHKRLYIEL